MNEKQATDDWSIARAIGSISPHLPDSMRPPVIETARGLKTSGARVLALCGLAAALPEPIAIQLATEAMTVAESIDEAQFRGLALVDIAAIIPQFKERASKKCLSALALVPNEWQRAKLLRRLARILPDDLGPDIIPLARAIKDVPTRTLCLASLAKHISVDERCLLLDSLERIPNEGIRLDALLELAEHLPPRSMAQALQYARNLSDPEDRATALALLLAHYPDQQTELVNDIVAIICGLANPYTQSGLLAYIAEFIPQTQLARVVEEQLSMVRASEDPLSQALIMSELARCLPQREREAVLQEVLHSAESINDQGLRGEILAFLLDALPEKFLTRAIRETLDAIQQVSGPNAS